jgi:predicted enzyme related to lactoylglutathione lyase
LIFQNYAIDSGHFHTFLWVCFTRKHLNMGEMMNNICHIELPSKDFHKARKFYGDVFSWQFEEMKEMNYLAFKAPEGVNGGFTDTLEPAQKPGIVFYIEVDDIEATIKKAEKAGGKCYVGKTRISPEIGYFAMLADLEGNQIGLWSKS